MLDWGMQLEFVKRIEYRQKTSNEFITALTHKFGDFYLIPEGGNNPAGIKGCSELLNELDQEYDYICCEVGSGTMLSSLVTSNKNPHTQFLGFAVMKNSQLEADIKSNLIDNKTISRWEIIHDYHFGGFAKSTDDLDNYIQNFKKENSIQLEPVYSGKMMYGIEDLIKQDFFEIGSKILTIHGGGLQGLRGFPQLLP